MKKITTARKPRLISRPVTPLAPTYAPRPLEAPASSANDRFRYQPTPTPMRPLDNYNNLNQQNYANQNSGNPAKPRTPFIIKFFKFIRRWFRLFAIALVLIFAIWGVHRLFFYKDNSFASQSKEANQIIQNIFDIPAGEPQVRVVEDADKIKSTQPFFANVQDGDLVLRYVDRVIIFRPTTRKIISIGLLPPEEAKIPN